MKYQFLKISLICVLIGILSGILSSSLIYSYFLSFMGTGNILMEKQDNSIQVKLCLMDTETKKNVLNSIVVFYKVKTLSNDPVKNVFLEKDRIGYGFVATSDGWVIADKIISTFVTKQIVAVLNDGKNLQIKKIEKDLQNDVVFIRLDATGLKPISFGSPRDLMPGENMYLVNESQKTTRIFFNGVGYGPAISETSLTNSSESFGKVLFFSESVDPDFNGLPILNYRGDVVGMVRGDGKTISTAVPTNYIQASLQSLFKNSMMKQIFLGLEYLDLSHIVTADEGQGRKGALILSVKDEKSSLRVGDIVLKINDDELNKEYNLSEILSEYQAGDMLDFYILREEREQVIKVRLGERK